jgi:hypothetical protein
MTAIAPAVLVGDDGALGPRMQLNVAFLDSLVGRLHAEYGGDTHDIRRLATEVLGTFATARVQTFVPILVEKRLRATYRALCGEGRPVRSGSDREIRPELPAVAGRHPR